MTRRIETGAAVFGLLAALLAGACTGGSETNAAIAAEPPREAPATGAPMDAKRVLGSIGKAIPVYPGAHFREDLTRRDEVMIRSRYGDAARVYTLSSDDSFPQVYHYYTTYLAQYRAYAIPEPYPPAWKNWRTLEVRLNEAMQDPFVPGAALDPTGRQVLLQVAETEAEPKTVIRYIVTEPVPASAAPQVLQSVAMTPNPAAPVAR